MIVMILHTFTEDPLDHTLKTNYYRRNMCHCDHNVMVNGVLLVIYTLVLTPCEPSIE